MENLEVTQAENAFVVDLAGWRVRDYRDFVQAVSANDVEMIAMLGAKVISRWPYDGSPADREAYLDLHLGNFGEVLREVQKAIRNAFSQGN